MRKVPLYQVSFPGSICNRESAESAVGNEPGKAPCGNLLIAATLLLFQLSLEICYGCCWYLGYAPHASGSVKRINLSVMCQG
jgi:hypothetical protein